MSKKMTHTEASTRLVAAILPGVSPTVVTRVDIVIRPADYPRATIDILIANQEQVDALVRVLREVEPELAVRVDTAWSEMPISRSRRSK